MGVIAGLSMRPRRCSSSCVCEVRARGVRGGARAHGRFLALTLLPGFAVGYLVMGLVWPWSVLSPLNPLRALDLLLGVLREAVARSVSSGQLISVPDMPASYLPTMFAIQLPEIMTALALAGAVLAWRRFGLAR